MHIAISTVALVISAIVGILTLIERLRNRSGRKHSTKEKDDLLTERRLTRVETQVEEIMKRNDRLWTNLEAKLAMDLHSPHTPILDALLEKINNRTITMEERKTLRDMLYEYCNDPNAKHVTIAKIIVALQEEHIEFAW